MNKLSPAKKITYFAVLTAITLLLQLVGNTVKIGIVTLNFSLIPIVLAAIILGWLYGAALGGITGLIILLNNGILGADGFTNVLFAQEPVIIVLTCILKTAVAGGVSGWLFSLIRKKSPVTAVFVASGIVPILNSGIFILFMLLITGALSSSGFIPSGANAFYVIVIGFVGLNFVFEFALNLIVAPALYRFITIIDPSFKTKAKTEKETENVTDNTEQTEKDGE